ncbi:MAG: CTP synthase (glutamine hydrolyzing) [archaeon]
MQERKYIVVTGGVLSGLGKGIAAASIGKLLSSRMKIVPIKMDGYLNVDPGTMNPIEHGEVFVLDDGGEVDMDFGHYERFLNITCKSEWNLTMGKVFERIRNKERRGDYLGKTVQFIPHVTNSIQEWVIEVGVKEQADLVLIEIGGTVGDIENELYIEACRELRNRVGKNNILYVHLTYVPIPSGVNEQKSKPTQQSVNLLRHKGIQPDVIIGRCSQYLEDKIKKKIAQFCNIDEEAVITGLDVDNIYKIPFVFEKEGLVEILHKKLNLYSPPELLKWKKLIANLSNPNQEVTIAICGKYTALEDSYASILEALKHCEANLQCKIKLKWIETSENANYSEILKDVHGVIVPGGFGSRGVEGKIAAVKFVRENNIPFLGICYGLQMAVIEYSRHICNLANANTTETDPQSPHKVICILPSQQNVTDKGGTMRLGAHDVIIKQNTKAYEMFGEKTRQRFRHRYEVNPEHIKLLEEHGMIFSGISEDNDNIMQIIELKDHPYFMAGQFHPELTSKLDAPHPMFYNLIKAALERKNLYTEEVNIII